MTDPTTTTSQNQDEQNKVVTLKEKIQEQKEEIQFINKAKKAMSTVIEKDNAEKEEEEVKKIEKEIDNL